MESNDGEALEILERLLSGQAHAPSAEEAVLLARAFPYMALPAAMRLRAGAGVDEEERARLVLRVAVMAPGRETLFRLLDTDGDLLRSFMPPEEKPSPTAKDTDTAIDTFLDTYGRMDKAEEALLEKLIFNPVPDDYALLLESEERDGKVSSTPEAPASEAASSPRSESQDRLLDAFLAGGEQPDPSEKSDLSDDSSEKAEKPSAKSLASAPPPSSSLSESLAQVYIRRGRYDKAFDIIHALSLNNPKKSVYFADQLRFLRKLMLNERLKNSSGGKRM